MLEIKPNGEAFYRNIQVNIKLCFPETYQDKYISLVNNSGQEIHFIEDLGNCPPEEKSKIKRVLEQATRKMKILDILKVEEEVELRVFHVLTNSGKTIFYTKLEDWPHHNKEDNYLIRDIHGDTYTLSLNELSHSAVKLIAPLI